MANTKVTGDLIASLTIATGNIANNAITSDKISGLTTAHITEGANLYYTDARARAAVSVSGNALSYNSSTGVITSNFEESPAFTGNVDVAGNITVGGNDSILAENNLRFKSSGAAYIDHNTTGQAINFRTSVSSSLDTTPLVLLGANVGIGTTSPSYKLEVVKTGADGINVNVGSDFGGIRLTSSTGAWSIRTSTGDDLFFYDVDNTNQAVTFKRGGNVGIGNTNPQHKIHFGLQNGYYTSIGSGNRTPGGAQPWLGVFDNSDIASATYGWGFYDSDADGSFQIWNKNNSTTGYNTFTIKRGGNVGIGTTSPTEKLRVQGVSGSDLLVRFQPFTNNAQTKLYLSSVSSGDGGYFYDANNNESGLFAYGDYTFYVGTSNISGSIGNPRMIIKQGGNVGIGITTPQTNLQVNGSPNGIVSHFGPGTNNGNGTWSAISLGYSEAGNAGYRKVGIATQTKGDGAARQDLHFLVDTASDSNSINISDSKMSIQYNTGDVIINNNLGIGTTLPGYKLEVNGGTALVGGGFYVSSDQSISTNFAYTFRDAVGINNPNSISATPNAGYTMCVGRSYNGAGVSGSLSAVGTIKATAFTVNIDTTAGIGGSNGDVNAAEIGPGYLNLSRDDTAAAQQIRFEKNGALHSYIETTTSGLNIGNTNVGIGTTSPGATLDVNDDNTGKLRLLRNGSVRAEFSNNANEGELSLYRSNNSKYVYLSSYYNCYIDPQQASAVVGIGGAGVGIASSGQGGNTTLDVQGPLRNKRVMRGWYHCGPITSTDAYRHIKTNLWMGGSPSGNTEYLMGGFEAKGYAYFGSYPGFGHGTCMFHNWSGSFASLQVANYGTAGFMQQPYVSTDGYCVIVLRHNTYMQPAIDFSQYYTPYPWRTAYVTAETTSPNATGVY